MTSSLTPRPIKERSPWRIGHLLRPPPGPPPLEKLTDTKLSYVPFTGAAPQVAAFLGGHVAAMLANSNDLVLHQDKQRSGLWLTGKVPLLRCTHLPRAGSGYGPKHRPGVGVPKGTPPERIAVLEEAFLAIMEQTDIQKAMIDQGFVPLRMSGEESQRYIQQVAEEYGAILQELNLTGAQ